MRREGKGDSARDVRWAPPARAPRPHPGDLLARDRFPTRSSLEAGSVCLARHYGI